MKQLVYRIPEFRGKQWFLKNVDRALGPFRLHCKHEVKVLGYLSSTQDASICSPSGDSPDLIVEIEQLPEDGVFIDCGSNSGFYSALAAKTLGPRGVVMSIEPSFREFERLRWARTENKHECCWTLFFTGAGDSMRVARIDSAVGHTGMNRIAEDSNSSGLEECPLLTLDFICENYLASGQQVDLVKIDVEGFEVNVLRGLGRMLSEQRIGRIFVEVTDKFLRQNGSSRNELYEYMESYGYTALKKSDHWQYDEMFVAPSDPSSIESVA